MAQCDAFAVAVGVPVRNEIERLPHLIAALAQQQGAPPFILCLFFDNCTDGSIEFVHRQAAVVPFLVTSAYCDAGNPLGAGAARGRAMALALRHVPDGNLLTTDADSEPTLNWVATNLAALAHADVVAGKITREDCQLPDTLARLGTYLDRLHQLRRIIDPVSWEAPRTHHWTSGASMAIRADVYLRLGGFERVRSGEDGRFVEAASHAGYRVRRDADVLVKTSSRRTGRVPDGFAAVLAEYDGKPALPKSWHPEDMAWRFRQHARARAAYRVGVLGTLAATLGISPAEALKIATESTNDEAFASRIVSASRREVRSIGLVDAEMLLSGLEQEHQMVHVAGLGHAGCQAPRHGAHASRLPASWR